MSTNPLAARLAEKLLAHAEKCQRTEATMLQLRGMVEDQRLALEESRVEEAAVAHLEAKLEDTAGALDDSRSDAAVLRRDVADVEARLALALAAKQEAAASVARLKCELAGALREASGLKRRLESLGASDRNGFGASCGGLQLVGLDLAGCEARILNATNMDVSLAGWTVRVVADESLVEAAGPDGALVVVQSPSRAAGNGGRRRNSDVARRHAFHFPFDFMLAAGSEATVRWGPELRDYGNGNCFHWLRPQDFDASDVVVVRSLDSEGDDADDAAAGAAAGAGDEDDPDAPLRRGALCLVDPNGGVSHTVPLMPDAGGGDPALGGRRARTSSLGSGGRRGVTFGGDSGGGGGGVGGGGGGGGNSGAGSTPWASRSSRFFDSADNTPVSAATSDRGGGGATPGATPGAWSTSKASWSAALATPRRLGERFAAAVVPQSGPGRWAAGQRPAATPLPEPKVPEGCVLM